MSAPAEDTAGRGGSLRDAAHHQNIIIGTPAAAPSTPAGTSKGPADGRPAAAAAAGAGRRPARKALTLSEMRSKAAFRACDRLMERGAADEAQLWSMARVMSAEEYEQTAEERSLAGKCGNPLCSDTPGGSQQQEASSGGRYHISTSQQAVYEKSEGAEQPIYCSTQCAQAVKQFAGRLGSCALALDRFTAMYELVKQQEQQEQQAKLQPTSAASAEAAGAAYSSLAAPPTCDGVPAAAPAAATAAAATAAPAAAADASAAPAAPAASSSGGDGCRDSGPGGIKSSTTLAPRLAVEQVEVIHIDSSAGQFGDFSRKIKPRVSPTPTAAGASSSNGIIGGAAGSNNSSGAPLAPKPKGVLKKLSKFAAGTAKVPIMLAEVKERDRSMVAADTARSLPSEAPAAARGSSKAAAAVEGYVPRATKSQQAAQKRRVRFSDEAEVQQQQEQEQLQDEQQQQQEEELLPGPTQQSTSQPPGDPLCGGSSLGGVSAALGHTLPQSSSSRVAGGSSLAAAAAPPAAPAAPGASHSSPAAAVAAGTAAAGPVLVFDVEDSRGPLEAGRTSLSAQFGSLRVADSLDLTTAAAAAAAASRAAAAGSSGGIDIQQRGGSSSGGDAAGQPVPREWLEVPQFYAHSPVGSSNNLSGSFGSGSNLAAIAASSSPPRGGSSYAPTRTLTSPPGLPRGPSSNLRNSSSRGSSMAAAAAATPQRQQPHVAPPQPPSHQAAPGSSLPGSSGGIQQAAEQVPEPNAGPRPTAQEQQELQQQVQQQPPLMTKRQAEQLQLAFPPLSAVLPPELQAALASDSDSDVAASDSEDWMRSDDELDGVQEGSSDDEVMPNGGKSSFRVQMSFFGMLFTHLEAWVSQATVELLAAGPDADLAPPPATSPEVLDTLSRCLAAALSPVLAGLQVAAARGQVERSLHELLRTLRLVGPLPPFKAGQWQVVAILFLKALSLERCLVLREAFETRDGIGRLNRMLGSLSFTSEEFWAALELLCPMD